MKRLILLVLCLAAPAMAQDSAFTRGVKALGEGRPRVARVEFMNAIAAAPRDPQPHLMQARTYLLLEDGVAAEAEARRAGSLGAPAADTRHMLAEAQLLQGDPQAALATLSGGPSRFPAAAARMKGRAHQALSNTAAAAIAYSEALRLTPRDRRLWIDIARFRLETGERAGAIAAADRALALRPDHLPAIVLRGVLVRTQYGLKAALPWFARALEADPANVPALVEQAATLGDLGRTRDMLAATRAILKAQPDNAEARYLQAALAARARNIPLARALFDRITGPVATTPAALLLGSTIDLQVGNSEQAIGRLETLLAAQPGNIPARRLLGLAHVRRGDGRSAVATLRPLEGEAIADPYTLALLAAAYVQSGNMPVAARALARSRAAGGGSGLLPVDLGGALDTPAFERAAAIRWEAASGNIWKAILDARQVALESPGAPEAHLLSGDASMLNGFGRAAAAEFRRAANLAFNEPAALRLVEALQRDGRGGEAAVVLELFLGQNPRSLAAERVRGNIRVSAGDWAGAIAAFESVRTRTGDHDPVLLNNLSWARIESGDAAAALTDAAAAYRLAPGNAATGDTFGWMLLKNGRDRAAALTLLDRAARPR